MDESKIVNQNKKENLFKYIPIIYPLLIFVGYINYDFYYRKFDIKIFNYLDTNEILFSFVSLIYPLALIPICIMFYILVIPIFAFLGDDYIIKQEDENPDDNQKKISFWSFKLKVDRLEELFDNINDCEEKFDNILRFLKSLIILLFSVIVKIAVGFFTLILMLTGFDFGDRIHALFFDNKIFFVFCLVVWVFTFLSFLKYKAKILGADVSTKFQMFFIFIVFVISLKYYQEIKVYNFFTLPSTEFVEFEYDDKIYKTDNENRLIGKTKDYIFIRNTFSNNNLIFKMSEVKNLIIKSTIYSELDLNQ